MRVAAGAFEGQPEKGRAEGDGAVGDILDPELLVDRSPLVGLAMVAVEGGGEHLVAGRIGEQIAGELPGHELIVRKVRIEGPNDPVAPGPGGAVDVGLIAVSIGIASKVEPVDGHSLAEPRRGEKPVDNSLVGVGTMIFEKFIDLGQGWGQADEIKANATDEAFLGRLGGRRDSFLIEFGQDEGVDWISYF